MKHLLPIQVTVLLLLTLAFPALAQQNAPAYKELKGMILSTRDSLPVANINIINISTHKGTLSSLKGRFSINVLLGDTLRLSAVNFDNRYMIIDERLLSYDKDLVIFMQPKDVELQPVTINGLPSWDRLRDAILNDVPPPEPNPIALKIPDNPFDFPLSLQAPRGGPQTGGVQSAATTMYFGSDPLGEKIRQENLMIAAWDKKQAYRAMINRKFNRDVVKSITGISEELLDEFMRTCTLSDSFIERSTGYEIGVVIKGSYIAFMEQR